MNETSKTKKVGNDLVQKIEQLRSQLVEAAQTKEFTNDSIVALSQQLDHYIVLAQYQMIGRS
ncbi:aspartyl-phosphate phosphatase Spo0E family protein [Paenibacillus turicensis]|nr:aspartyl-phosphate phosphatase Spo0E family protein [Paenibacillus turicensis]